MFLLHSRGGGVCVAATRNIHVNVYTPITQAKQDKVMRCVIHRQPCNTEDAIDYSRSAVQPMHHSATFLFLFHSLSDLTATGDELQSVNCSILSRFFSNLAATSAELQSITFDFFPDSFLISLQLQMSFKLTAIAISGMPLTMMTKSAKKVKPAISWPSLGLTGCTWVLRKRVAAQIPTKET